ncbi:MAG: putative porin [Bacteroidota bacterium]
MRLVSLHVRLLFWFFAVGTNFSLFCQIVDDSTKQVYGPKTTKYLTEEVVLNNLGDYQVVDTSLYLMERQSLVDKSNRELQDLGVIGTALFPVFHTPSKTYGRTSGYNSYYRFATQPNEVKYYDTKSPFFDLFAMLGGGNRNIVDVAFSRNVNPNWNVGFDYKRLTVDKQLAVNGEGDRQVQSSSFVGSTHYKNQKIPYQIMFHYSQLNHNTVELGGVRYLTENRLRSELFEFENALLRLEDATTNFKERRIHLYHDYQIADQFQLYHLLDRRSEENTYKDFADDAIGDYDPYGDFYSNFLIDEDSTYQRTNFISLSNEAGIKGEISSIFYRTYLRFRWVDFSYNYLDPRADKLEQYIGGYARFKWKDKFSIVGNAEYLRGGEYTIGGNLSSNFINASYQTSKYAVPFIYQRYFGNHHEWNNSFSPVFTNQLEGSIRFIYSFLELRPTLHLTSYQNYLYFDQERQARQSEGTFLISRLGGKANFRFLNQKEEGWHLENEVYFTNVAGEGASLVRIPKLFYNGRVFWRGNWFSDLVPFEVGLDMHTRSAYFANNFAPEIQQFYLQDEYEIEGYFKADFFINMRLDNFFFSLKWTHVDQPTDGGYFASPFYPGQPRSLDLNVKWRFFD